MYRIKEEQMKFIKEKYRSQYIADVSGLSKTYISLILNRKKRCPKRTAYIITKAIDEDAEILDFFDIER